MDRVDSVDEDVDRVDSVGETWTMWMESTAWMR